MVARSPLDSAIDQLKEKLLKTNLFYQNIKADRNHQNSDLLGLKEQFKEKEFTLLNRVLRSNNSQSPLTLNEMTKVINLVRDGKLSKESFLVILVKAQAKKYHIFNAEGTFDEKVHVLNELRSLGD